MLVWWFSTGAVLFLDGLPRRTFGRSLAGATVVVVGAIYGLLKSSTGTATTDAYCAFTCALLIWAWLEMSFLLGFITGPRQVECPRGCNGWPHFRHALGAIFYHELALLGGAAVVFVCTREQPNQVGAWTFSTLWMMRQSAKLNVFLGVPNLSEEFLPEHLKYLRSFFTRRPMNLLFPISITVSTIVATLLILKATALEAPAFEATGFTLVATLMVLAVFEHWCMVVPIPVNQIWGWGMRSRLSESPRLDSV